MAPTLKKIYNNVMVFRKLFVFVLTPIVTLPILFSSDTQIAKVTYMVAVMALYFVSEAIPMAMTGMLPIVMLPLLGVLSTQDTCRLYFRDLYFLVLAFFSIAIAIQKFDIHKRIAIRIMLLFGTQITWLMLGIMVATAFLSMWMGNAIVVSMMIPIVKTLVNKLREIDMKVVHHAEDALVDMADDGISKSHETRNYTNEEIVPLNEDEETSIKSRTRLTPEQKQRQTYNTRVLKAFTLSVAYAANLGGAITLIGSPPNLIFQNEADNQFARYNMSAGVDFVSWFTFSGSVAFINFTLTWLWIQLTWLRCPDLFSCCKKKLSTDASELRVFLQNQYTKLGPMGFPEISLLVHFLLLVTAVMTEKLYSIPGWGVLFPPQTVSSACPAVLILLSLYVFPHNLLEFIRCRDKDGNPIERPILKTLVTWGEIKRKIPWGLFWMIGGGFAIVEATRVSGLSDWIGEQLAQISDIKPEWAPTAILTAIVTITTEFTCNVAIITIMSPILFKMGLGMGKNPLALMLPATVASSFAFMMPIATASNAVVFTFGTISVSDMFLTGIFVNVYSLIVLNIAANTWGASYFDWNTLPAGLRAPNVTLPYIINNGTLLSIANNIP